MLSRWSQAILGGAVASLVISFALGQSSPGLVKGQVPTADQWNSYFAAKQDLLGFTPVNKAGDTMTGELKMPASTSANAMFKLPEGQAPANPKNGDVWTTSAGMFAQIEGDTVGPFGPTGENVACPQLPAFFGDVTSTGGTCQIFIPNGVFTSKNQTFTKSQRAQITTLSISGSAFTPDFDASQNFTLTLVHASCPCTIANPSTSLVAGQTGVIEIVQSSSGSDAVTWGSEYVSQGGTGSLTLSTVASARDYLSYYVDEANHIVVTEGALNAIH